jgi:hypothetical protein
MACICNDLEGKGSFKMAIIPSSALGAVGAGPGAAFF